jgi:AhpD family alkylhydroperoxidase
MLARFDYGTWAPGVYDAMDAVDRYLAQSSIDSRLLLLVQLRASQVNGCAYCLNMHWRDLRKQGESEQRLYSLDAWAESPFYSDRERAALAWTDAVTRIADTRAADEVYERCKPHFSDRELADLTFAIAGMNAWNRLSIAARLTPRAAHDVPAVPEEAIR